MASSANNLLREARKMAASRGWFSGSSNQEAAAELYGQAGDAFKLEKECTSTGRWE